MPESLLSWFRLIYAQVLLNSFLLGLLHIFEILIFGLIVLRLIDTALQRVWTTVVSQGSGNLLADKFKDQVLDRPKILGIDKMSDDGSTVRLAVKTLPSKRAEVTREWRRLIREVLDKEGIELSQKKEI